MMTNGADSLRHRFRRPPFQDAISRTTAGRRAEAPHVRLVWESHDSQSESLLYVDEQRDGNRAVVTAAGEVDVISTVALQRALERARDSGAPEIWLDLTDTTFMDCAGLHALLDLRAGLAEATRRLVLICPAGPVLRLLSLTGADREFEIHPTRTAAHNGC